MTPTGGKFASERERERDCCAAGLRTELRSAAGRRTGRAGPAEIWVTARPARHCSTLGRTTQTPHTTAQRHKQQGGLLSTWSLGCLQFCRILVGFTRAVVQSALPGRALTQSHFTFTGRQRQLATAGPGSAQSSVHAVQSSLSERLASGQHRGSFLISVLITSVLIQQ